jgi:hypothetical protein
MKELGLQKTKASKLPDDDPLLHILNEKEFIIKTPA